MSNQNNLSAEELMRLAAQMKSSGEGESDTMAKLLKDRLPEDKRRQFNSIINDKQALEKLLHSEEAQRLMKKLGGNP